MACYALCETKESFKMWLIVYVVRAHKADIWTHIIQLYNKINLILTFKGVYEH